MTSKKGSAEERQIQWSCLPQNDFVDALNLCADNNVMRFQCKCGYKGCTNRALSDEIIDEQGNKTDVLKNAKYTVFMCETHHKNNMNKDEILANHWRLWDILTGEPVKFGKGTNCETCSDSNNTNLYQEFIEWLADKIIHRNGDRMHAIRSLERIKSLPELIRYLAEIGVLGNNPGNKFEHLDNIMGGKIKAKSMGELRKTHKRLTRIHKNIMKKKGGGDFMENLKAIGEFFMAIINAIIKLVELIIGAVNQAAEREEQRRKEEQEKADREQREKELNQMLFDYNNQLRDLSTQANMPVRDYVILNLKDDSSRVSDMKRTILAKAADFKMSEPDFVDYCLKIAGSNSWWYVAELLKVMKEEFDSPGLIANAKITPPNLANLKKDIGSVLPVAKPVHDYDDYDDYDSFDDDEPIYANVGYGIKKYNSRKTKNR